MDDHTVTGRVFEILDVVDAHGPSVTLARLTTLTGIPKPTTLRLANDLVRRGWLTKDTDGYRLGARLARLGLSAGWQQGYRDDAAIVLHELRQRTRCAVSLSSVLGARVMLVDWVNPPDVRVDAGELHDLERPPALTTSATGRVALALRPDLADAVMRTPLPRTTRYTQNSPKLFRDDLRRTSERGFALEFEQFKEGWACSAAPVVGSDGAVVAAVAVAGRPTHITRRTVPLLLDATRDLGRQLTA